MCASFKWRHLSLFVFLWLALFSAQAIAAIESAGILDDALAKYSAAASSWGDKVAGRATWLFWTLVVVSMVWTFGIMAVRRADLGEFYAEFVRFTIFTGFFWWLLFNGPKFAGDIMNGLRQIGSEAAGLPSGIAPSGIVDIGFDIFAKTFSQSDLWKPIDSLVGITVSLVILIVFALVGVNMLVLLVSGWVLAYAGVFFLGFGGSRWTSEIAIGYYKTVLNIGAQLFTMVLLVGIGTSFVDQFYASMSAGIMIKELVIMLVVAVILLVLINRVPGLVGGLAGGSGTSTLGSGFGAGAVLGAAAVAGAAMSTAGAAIASGAAGMAGGTQALMAAFSKAHAAESAGGGMDLLNASGGSGASNVAGSPLADAMGASGLATPASSGTPTSVDAKADQSSVNVVSAKAPVLGEATTGGTFGTKPGRTSGRGTKSPTAQTAAAGGAENGGAPGEVKRSVALKAAGAVAAKVAKVAGGTVGNLAVGSWDVAKAKLGDIHASARDRVGETTGGKIAAAIKVHGAGQKTVSFGEDSLSAGSESLDRQSEVAAFRDRS